MIAKWERIGKRDASGTTPQPRDAFAWEHVTPRWAQLAAPRQRARRGEAEAVADSAGIRDSTRRERRTRSDMEQGRGIAVFAGIRISWLARCASRRSRLPILPEIAFSRLANRSPLPAVAVFAGIRIFAFSDVRQHGGMPHMDGSCVFGWKGARASGWAWEPAR